MKETLENIFAVIGGFIFGIAFNCMLVWMGYFGLIVTVAIMLLALAGYISIEKTGTSVGIRVLMMFSVGFFYVTTIWFPETLLAACTGFVIIALLWMCKNFALTQYTSSFVLYIVTWDIAFYLMGDTVLEWADAVLVATALVCSGIWVYHARTLEH